MLLVFKNHVGDLELEVNGVKKTLLAFGAITDIDDSFYKEAKKKYPFLDEWEKQGIIEKGQNVSQKDDTMKEALAKQKELEATNKKLAEELEKTHKELEKLQKNEVSKEDK